MTKSIFFSVGEPSGDVHGGNLIRALQAREPGVRCRGFGGDRMAAAGCELVYPLCNLAVMGVRRVLDHAGTFVRLLDQAERIFRKQRPDAVVLIDYPGFNWWIARAAHAQGIPVFYFVPPQLWAWMGWRVRKMRRFVDHVLCSLPFEPAWYRRRGVTAHYVGHPFFDDLPMQQLDSAFLADQRGAAQAAKPLSELGLRVSAGRMENARFAVSPMGSAESPIIGILPGSRNQEVEHNIGTLHRTAALIHEQRPDVRFLVACYKLHQQQLIDEYLQSHEPLPITTHVGKTPEIIELAQATIAVSGSVSLELLWRAKPSIIVYRLSRMQQQLVRWLVKVRFMSLVNLLAEKELYPEFPTTWCPSAPVADHVLGWLNDAAAYADLTRRLAELRDRVAAPGACDRTAQFILERIATRLAA
jgi:lipid-A-disaccharide synthase